MENGSPGNQASTGRAPAAPWFGPDGVNTLVTHYPLTDEQRLLQRLVRQFAFREVRPRVRALDQGEPGATDPVLIQRACALGLATGFLPRRWGGTMTGLGGQVALEELASVDAGIAILFATTGLGIAPIALSGDEAQMQRFFPAMVEAEERGDPILWALAATERWAGNDMQDAQGIERARLETIARPVDGGYRLEGIKSWVSAAGVARWLLVVAALNRPGKANLTCFAVPTDAEGVRLQAVYDTAGLRSLPVGEYHFDNLFLPAENRIGPEGGAWPLLQQALAYSRATTGTLGVGLARGACQIALRHAAKRRQGGRYLIAQPMVQRMLADMALQIEQARLLAYHAAQQRPPLMKLSAMAKIAGTEAAVNVATLAMRVLGSAGSLRENHVERYLRDAETLALLEGANDVNRVAIAEELMREVNFTPDEE